MPSPRILVIDDQHSHLRIIKKMLERYGCKAKTVDSAEEAELILEWGQEYGAIITDLKMPWLNGIEFCKRAKSKYPRIKIYALSGNPDLFDYDELSNAGFDGFYFKPITHETIENILLAIATSSPES